MDKNILVAVRMRPLIPREIEKNKIYWKAIPPKTIGSCEKPVTYNFDRVFDSKVQNEEIYSEICSDIVRSVVNGFNGTIFAYGQSASGKTYTMVGKEEKNILGIMQYAIEDIFNLIQNMTEREFLLRVSYMEIYKENVRDLLSVSGDNLKTTEENGQIKVQNLEEKRVQKPEQILQYMKDGERRRKTGETPMNEKSSRSHAIFRMIIESCLRGVEDAAVNVSQFNLVDLAGSERGGQTGATGVRLEESKQINKSLLSLGKVIRQLSENENQFISYRDSKLTRILQNSLGGNSLTAIICTVTAACFNETQSTLKFAERAKNITNKPTVIEVLTEQALLKKYANEIKKLTAEMKDIKATKEENSQQIKELQEKIKNFENLFVFQVNPSLNLVRAKSNQRKTWGGSLDAARFRKEIASQNPVENQKSFSLCNLSILEEHSKAAEAEKFFSPNQSTQQIKTSKRSSDFRWISNSKRSSNLLGIAEAATQTEAAGLSPSPKLFESDCDKIKMMANLNSEGILQMEIVQGALKKARQEEREIFIAELEKKNEELKSLKAELDNFKKSSLKQGSHLQNDPFKGFKTVEANVFTPKTKPDNPVVTGKALHPKMLRKKVLKETNRKSIAPFPSSKKKKRKESINDENMNPFSIPIHLEEAKTKKPTLKETNRKPIAPFPTSKKEKGKESIYDDVFATVENIQSFFNNSMSPCLITKESQYRLHELIENEALPHHPSSIMLTLKSIVDNYFFHYVEKEAESTNQAFSSSPSVRKFSRVKKLKKFSSDPINGDTELHKYCRLKLPADVLKALYKDTSRDINSKNSAGNTPLHEACLANCYLSAKFLIEEAGDRKVDFNATANDGRTPLHCAVNVNSSEIVKLLLDKGGNNLLKSKDKWNKKPLDYSISVEMKRFLSNIESQMEEESRMTRTRNWSIFSDKNKKLVSYRGDTELHKYCRLKLPADVLEALYKDTSRDINSKNSAGNTPLHEACLANCYLSAKFLIEEAGDRKVDFNATANDGRTPLHCAVNVNSSEIVKLLLDRGGNNLLKSKDNWSKKPIDYCISDEMKSFLINIESQMEEESHETSTQTKLFYLKRSEDCPLYLRTLKNLVSNYCEIYDLPKDNNDITALSHDSKDCYHYKADAKTLCSEDSLTLNSFGKIIDKFVSSVELMTNEGNVKTELLHWKTFATAFK